MINLYPFIRPFIFALPPEKAHSLTLAALKTGFLHLSPCLNGRDARLLHTEIAGLSFTNPLGMAAGFDKNAEVADEVFRLGFGSAEIGTVTPRPQEGNAAPRLFRLVRDKAVINRMGFNNAGHEAVYHNLAARQARLRQRAEKIAAGEARPPRCAAHKGILGVNIGANKDSEDKIADYLAGLEKFYPLAGYFTANISSPNTPGLRDLQNRDNLRRLLAELAVKNAELTAKHGFKRPIFLKIAPDLSEKELDDIAAEFSARPLDGLVVANTTLSRAKLADKKLAAEAGGLSGKPLFSLSTIILAKMRQRLGKSVPLIGAGGVGDSQSALAKIRAGADMVQLYSSLIYQGPWAVPAIVKGLSSACRYAGVAHISALRDTETEIWAAKPLKGKNG